MHSEKLFVKVSEF